MDYVANSMAAELHKKSPPSTTTYCSTGSITQIHLPLKSMSNLTLNSMLLLLISKETILIDSELSRYTYILPM